MKVYEYLWRAPEGDFLRLVFDRQSWGIIEIENEDLIGIVQPFRGKAGCGGPPPGALANREQEGGPGSRLSLRLGRPRGSRSGSARNWR